MAHLHLDLTTSSGRSMGAPSDDGWHHAFIEKTEIKPSQKGDSYLSMAWRIMEGKHKDRVIFDNALLSGPNKDFGHNRLKNIAFAIGHPNPNYIRDSVELTNRACYIKTRQVPSKDPRYDDETRINKYVTEKAYYDMVVKGEGAGAPPAVPMAPAPVPPPPSAPPMAPPPPPPMAAQAPAMAPPPPPRAPPAQAAPVPPPPPVAPPVAPPPPVDQATLAQDQVAMAPYATVEEIPPVPPPPEVPATGGRTPFGDPLPTEPPF
jgi:hypothetical protein